MITLEDLEIIEYLAQLASEQDTTQSFDWDNVEDFNEVEDNQNKSLPKPN